MKKIISITFVISMSLLSSCNGAKKDSSLVGSSLTGPETSLPLKFQLTDEELKELKSEGLISENNLNEIRKINKK